jgi:hypothetical protein
LGLDRILCGKRALPRRLKWSGEAGGLFSFGIELQDVPGFFEVEEVSVDDELPVAGVGRHLVDAFDGVTAVSKLFDEKIDVYIHGDQYTQGWWGANGDSCPLRADIGGASIPGSLRPSDYAPAFGRAEGRFAAAIDAGLKPRST